MVAVDNLNVNTGFCHEPRDFAQLTWLFLIQALNEDFLLLQHVNPGILKCSTGFGRVLEQKVDNTLTFENESATALNANACSP